MPLVQVIHSIQAVTATVPFSMIMLLDHMKRKSIPPELRIRMIFPTNGLQSTSIWDVPDIDQLQAWLDEYLGDDCINTICEVQEDFAWGIAAALGTARGTEVVSAQAIKAAKTVGEKASNVAGNAAHKIGELDERYGVSKQATETLSTAKEKTGAAYAGASKSISEMSSKAMENERVAKTVTTVGSYSSAAWKRIGTGVGFLKAKIAEVSETVAQSVQEYNSAETLQGDSSISTEALSGGSGALAAASEPSPQELQESTPVEPTFAGFDDDDDGGAVEQKDSPDPFPEAAPISVGEVQPVVPEATTAEEQRRYTIEDDSLEADEEGLAAIRLSEDGESSEPVSTPAPAADVQDELSAFIDAEEKAVNDSPAQ